MEGHITRSPFRRAWSAQALRIVNCQYWLVVFAVSNSVACIRFGPTAMQSINENEFEYSAVTGVNTPYFKLRSGES
jgi:hypothetical protein